VTITITSRAISGTGTAHTARRYGAGWVVSWLPGRVLTQGQAITAMKIAAAARRARRHDGPLRARAHEWGRRAGPARPARPADGVMSGPAREQRGDVFAGKRIVTPAMVAHSRLFQGAGLPPGMAG